MTNNFGEEVKKKLDDIKEEEAWTDWHFASTIWNFNVGKNAREGVHGLEDTESVQYHTGRNPDKLYLKTAFAGKLVPHLVRKLIHKYSERGDLILDAFCGSGTIPVEAKLNGRKCIAIDINPLCVELTRRKLRLLGVTEQQTDYQVYQGDARDLSNLGTETIDCIITHPPYWGLIDFSRLENDISNLSLRDYLVSMRAVMGHFYQLLKPQGFCIIIIGDSRKLGIVPLGSYLIHIGLEAGFNLWDLLIYDTRFGGKQVHKFRRIKSQQKKFHLTDHDFILIFQKRKQGWQYLKLSEILENKTKP